MPKILIIHLNRFRQLFRSGEKINIVVRFPLKGLDLSAWLQKTLHTKPEVSKGGASAGEASQATDPECETLADPECETLADCMGGYDLFAVLNHSGGLHSGHYTAMAKHPDSDIWYKYNDSRVSKLSSSSSLINRDAYILFYVRTTT